MTEENNDQKQIKMYGIWLMDGHPEPIALFEFVEHAEEWARDNYFGQWLMHEVEIPVKHPMDDLTDEQLEKIKANAKELAKKFNPLPVADDE